MRNVMSDSKPWLDFFASTSFLSLAIFLAFLALPSCPADASKPLKPGAIFQAAQRCRVNGTVDYGCFQQKLQIFEQFVLEDQASWIQKSLVAEALVKTYDALHTSSPFEPSVRAKQRIYAKALGVLDASERGQIDDCKDEANPDGCLKGRYCFKEAYIKAKNVLITNEPERFKPEILWFDKGVQTNC
jgi:hypothetical protein